MVRVHDRSKKRWRRRAAWVLALAVMAVLMVVARRHRHDRALLRMDESSPPDQTAEEALRPRPEDPRTAKPPAPAASRPPPDPPPVIDEILVEKPEVCAGEENLITVRAHTVNGTDEFLHYAIDGNGGASVPLRLWLDESGRVEGKHTISVFGRTNSALTVEVPEYKVKDCQPQYIAAIVQRLRANSWSDFDFLAKVVAPAPPSGPPRPAGNRATFTPATYSWSFGDGDEAVTTEPAVTHSYEARKQDTLYSYFTVRVEIRSTDGRTVVGRTTLPLINPAFEALARKGVVVLLIALDPRFPELGEDGRVRQRVRLRHTRPGTVTIEGVAETKYFETGAGETAPRAVDVAGLLGTSVIPAGRDGITTTAVLDTVADPGVFSTTYRLTGHSDDGYPVAGSFSVMRPPRRPSPENSEPVTDPRLRAKILAAKAILGRDVVDDEDIWRLEREGKLR